MSDGIIITAIICATILAICWLDKSKKGSNKK